jgi:hypothetical protein
MSIPKSRPEGTRLTLQVYNSSKEASRRAWEAMMKGYEYQSDFAKKYVARTLDRKKAVWKRF